jgi:outer membrane protein TolC
MHDRGASAYTLGDDLRGTPRPNPYAHMDKRSLVAQAFEQRREPRAILESAGALRKQADAALAAELPRLDAVGNAQYASPNQRYLPQRDEFHGSWDATLQVSWTPTDIFGSEAGRSSTEARARKLDAQRAELLDGIELEVKQELLSLRRADAAMQSSERGLASASESYRVRRVMFQNGAARSVELTDAENDWSRAQLELIEARIDRRIADVRLAHALGADAAKQAPPGAL